MSMNGNNIDAITGTTSAIDYADSNCHQYIIADSVRGDGDETDSE